MIGTFDLCGNAARLEAAWDYMQSVAMHHIKISACVQVQCLMMNAVVWLILFHLNW